MRDHRRAGRTLVERVVGISLASIRSSRACLRRLWRERGQENHGLVTVVNTESESLTGLRSCTEPRTLTIP